MQPGAHMMIIEWNLLLLCAGISYLPWQHDLYVMNIDNRQVLGIMKVCFVEFVCAGRLKHSNTGMQA